MKAIIISRVSTQEQMEAGNSLPAQEERLIRYCQSKGFEIVAKHSFDESAYKDKRVEFDEIVNTILAYKEKVAVCFDKIDRLSRNVFDSRVNVLYERSLNDEMELHFASDGQVINSQISASQKFAFTLTLGLGKYYSDAISDNTKRGIEGKLLKGEWPGKAPFGYSNITNDDGTKTIEVHPLNSKIVQQIYAWYVSRAYSMNQVIDMLQEHHGLKWNKSKVGDILNNEFYVGVMTRGGRKYDHIYRLIIEREIWDKVKEIKYGRYTNKAKISGLDCFKYRGVLRCDDCGCAITHEKQRGHNYYHCTQSKGKHGAKYLREEAITEQLGDLFDKMKIPDEVIDEIRVALKANHVNKADFYHEQYKKFTQEHEKYEKRIEVLYDDRADGRITESEYTKRYERYRQEQRFFDNKLKKLTRTDDEYYMQVTYLVEIAKRAGELFRCSKADEKRQLMGLVLSNMQVKGKKVLYEVQKPFDAILKYAERPSWGG
jgi:site-specific DNA recombinase